MTAPLFNPTFFVVGTDLRLLTQKMVLQRCFPQYRAKFVDDLDLVGFVAPVFLHLYTLYDLRPFDVIDLLADEPVYDQPRFEDWAVAAPAEPAPRRVFDAVRFEISDQFGHPLQRTFTQRGWCPDNRQCPYPLGSPTRERTRDSAA